MIPNKKMYLPPLRHLLATAGDKRTSLNPQHLQIIPIVSPVVAVAKTTAVFSG